MTPLTAEEIAELRGLYTPGAGRHVENLIWRALDEVERARALLKRIEWGGLNSGACPECGATSADWYVAGKHAPEMNHHEPGCELAALIGAPSGVRPG